MQSVLKITIVTLCLALGSQALPGILTRKADMSLMQFMTSSRVASADNPQRSMACFDYYVPKLNAITEQYEISYETCLNNTAQAKSLIDQSTQADRKIIEASVTSSCDLLGSCGKLVDSINYFECYVNAGSENAKEMYTISANSTEILNRVREDYRSIDNKEDICKAAAERAYVENTADTYEQLQNCVQGKSPVPSS